MGCCGSCGGEAPNHINDQDKNKEKDKEVTSQPQEQDKVHIPVKPEHSS